MASKGPYLPDIKSLIEAGIDPRTKLPIKMASAMEDLLKGNIKKVLRVMDEQDAVNRYQWHGLPEGIDGELIERIIYYKYKGMLFYHEKLDKFYFLPYTLDGNIDVVGRWTGVKPLPFMGTQEDGKPDKKNPYKVFLDDIHKTPVYSVMPDEDVTLEIFTNSAVLLYDYSKQLSQTDIPRQALNDGILDLEAECFPYLRTNLINSTGIRGVRVGNADEEQNVSAAAASMKNAALNGKMYVPIQGALEFQDMTSGTVAKSEEYMLAMRSIDNFRLQTYGLENGGLFEKKAHVLENEQQMNAGNTSRIYQDGLRIRQQFCMIANSIWGLSIWCDTPEYESGIDMNGNGLLETQDSQEPYTGGNEDENATEI